jgi:hypothetical protein
MTLLLGQTTPDVPWSVTQQWLYGLLGLLGVIWLVLAVVIQFRKLFGRTPPLTDELDKRDKAIRAMIFAAEKHLKDEQARQLGLIVKLEEQYADMQADRVRKWDELQIQISEQNSTLSYIRGKLDQQDRDNS